MGLSLELHEVEWAHDAPQPGGTPIRLPHAIHAWKRTLGASDMLRSLPGGMPYAAWLDAIVESGAGEQLVFLTPVEIGALQATWATELRRSLPALRQACEDHDFSGVYGVRDGNDVEAVLVAWARCVDDALLAERGLIGMRT